MAKLERSFYARPTLDVAKSLLGKMLVHRLGRKRVSGIIVETEAYLGPSDIASHARHGAESRARPMFGEPGHAYIYFTYGMHHCLNCVTEPAASGTAVLLRALEPAEGIEVMRMNRTARNPTKSLPDRELTNGPGKLCQALGLDTSLNEADLLGNQLWVEDAPDLPDRRIGATPRVGIREGREPLWRFYDKDSYSISRHPNY